MHVYARKELSFYDEHNQAIHLPIQISAHLPIHENIWPYLPFGDRLLPVDLVGVIFGLDPLCRAGFPLYPKPKRGRRRADQSKSTQQQLSASSTYQNEHSSSYRHHRPITIKAMKNKKMCKRGRSVKAVKVRSHVWHAGREYSYYSSPPLRQVSWRRWRGHRLLRPLRTKP